MKDKNDKDDVIVTIFYESPHSKHTLNVYVHFCPLRPLSPQRPSCSLYPLAFSF